MEGYTLNFDVTLEFAAERMNRQQGLMHQIVPVADESNSGFHPACAALLPAGFFPAASSSAPAHATATRGQTARTADLLDAAGRAEQQALHEAFTDALAAQERLFFGSASGTAV